MSERGPPGNDAQAQSDLSNVYGSRPESEVGSVFFAKCKSGREEFCSPPTGYPKVSVTLSVGLFIISA